MPVQRLHGEDRRVGAEGLPHAGVVDGLEGHGPRRARGAEVHRVDLEGVLVRVREQRLRGRDHTQGLEARQVREPRDLDVLDAVPAPRRAVHLRRVLVRPQGLVDGAVADGVKEDLEAFAVVPRRGPQQVFVAPVEVPRPPAPHVVVEHRRRLALDHAVDESLGRPELDHRPRILRPQGLEAGHVRRRRVLQERHRPVDADLQPAFGEDPFVDRELRGLEGGVLHRGQPVRRCLREPSAQRLVPVVVGRLAARGVAPGAGPFPSARPWARPTRP